MCPIHTSYTHCTFTGQPGHSQLLLTSQIIKQENGDAATREVQTCALSPERTPQPAKHQPEQHSQNTGAQWAPAGRVFALWCLLQGKGARTSAAVLKPANNKERWHFFPLILHRFVFPTTGAGEARAHVTIAASKQRVFL